MASQTHEVAADQAAQAAGGHGGEAVGLPQLDFSTFGNQIFWLLVALVVTYFILSRIAMPRIAGILSERQGTITSDLVAAEDLKAKAHSAEAAYNQALADARTEAQEIIAKAKAEAKSELDAAMAKADAQISEKTAESMGRINEIRSEAISHVEQISKDVTMDIVAAMGSKADAKSVEAAVTNRLKG